MNVNRSVCGVHDKTFLCGGGFGGRERRRLKIKWGLSEEVTVE